MLSELALHEAQLLILRGEAQDAFALLKSQPESLRVVMLQSESQLALRNFDSCRSLAERAFRLTDGDQASEASLYTLYGRSFQEQGAFPQAQPPLTDAVTLLERLDDRVRSLSGGQMRRIEIAGALLHRPRLLLLDEPTVGVDIASRQAIVDHVHHLCREDRLSVLWATHLDDEVRPGDRVVILHRGRILAHGDVGDVIRNAGVTTIREAYSKLTGAGQR